MSGPCIVVGTAKGFLQEFEEAQTLLGNAPVFCVNRAAEVIDGNFWVTVHPEVFFHAESDMIKISDRVSDEVDVAFPIATQGGSSSLLAVLVALVMGSSLVVTAGVHLDGKYKPFQGRWRHYKSQIGDRIRSMSAAQTYISKEWGIYG